VKGPAFFLAGIGGWALLDANSKLLAGTYPLWQVLGIRHLVLVALMLAARALLRGAGGPLGTDHPGLHLLRATAMLGSAAGFFLALRSLPLADGYLVYFTAPFMTMAMAALLLGERQPGPAWLWTAVGFSGVALALWPQLRAGGSWAAYLWALFGTVCYATVLIVSRRLRHERGMARIILWPGLFGLLCCLPGMVAEWQPPGAADLARLAANGVLAGGATALLAAAFRHAEVARLAPFEFSALLWALGLDLAVWGVLPAWTTLAGAGIVVAACVMSERAAARRVGRRAG